MTPPVLRRRRRRVALPIVVASAGLALTAASADAAQIAAVSTTPGKIDVFTRDPSTGQLRQSSFDQATGLWSAWALRGGALKSGTEIAAVSRSTTSIDVFFRNTSDLVQRTTATGTSWSTPATVSSNTANGGPSAVVTGTTVQIVARNLNDGTFQRHTWTPSSGAVSTAWSNLGMTTSGGPGISATSSTSVQVATTGTNGTQPYFNAINAGVAAVWDLYAQRQTLPGTTSGTPAVTSQSTGSTDITARTPSGGISRLSRATEATAWPTSWTALATPPATEAAGSAPATIAYKATSTATPVIQTFLPTAAGTNFLTHTNAAGWSTAQPGYTPPVPKPSDDGPAALAPGTIRYFGRTDDDATWNNWFSPSNTPTANRAWLNSKVWRMEMFSPSGNPATSWFSGGMAYYQLYTIDATTAANNPNWVLRDSDGNPLYAADGATPHNLVAGNIFDAGYRQYQINRINALFSGASYRGIWLDNVNLELGDSGLVKQVQWNPALNGGAGGWDWAATTIGALAGYATGKKAYARSGAFPTGDYCTAASIPAGTPTNITDSCWAVGIAEFVAQIKAALPSGKELLTNTPWYRFQRSVDTGNYGTPAYNFIKATSGVGANRPASGVPTGPGQKVVDNSTYVDFERSFWLNSDPSGNGPTGAPVAGPSANDYSLDTVFRWIDGVHARGKGIVADSATLGDVSALAEPAKSAAETPLRIREFNLAGYLLTTNGQDGIGDYDLTNANWPAITGSGGTSLYDMNIGVASALPSGATAAGGGANGRGVVTIGSAGNRLYVRKFTRTDGKSVFTLLSEAGTGTNQMTGGNVSYTIPATGCSDMTRSAGSPPSYRTLNTSTSVVTLAPRAAAIVLCN